MNIIDYFDMADINCYTKRFYCSNVVKYIMEGEGGGIMKINNILKGGPETLFRKKGGAMKNLSHVEKYLPPTPRH